jgi:hypothetical protein
LGAASGGGWLALSNPAGGCVKGRAGDTPVGATPPVVALYRGGHVGLLGRRKACPTQTPSPPGERPGL